MKQEFQMRAAMIASLSAVFLVACGGGNQDPVNSAAAFGDPANAIVRTPPEFEQRKIQGVAVGAKDAGPALTYADMLFDWAEVTFPQYFPSHSSTLVEGQWYYRSYFASGVMLGINSGYVYVMGGPFGAVPQNVGRAYDYVAPPNTAPSANAGPAQTVGTGATVTLNGSNSSDANGDALSYSWTLTARPFGSGAVLFGAASSKPTFTADVAGVYSFQLIVNDGRANSVASTTSVTAVASGLACAGVHGDGTGGVDLYSPSNNFTYNLSTVSASAYDIVTTTWGASFSGPIGSYTGSLKTKLWAVKTPYSGGSISGTVLGEFSPLFSGSGAHSATQINGGGYSITTIQSSVGNYNPVAGQYCLVMTLLQYMPGQCNPSPDGYCIVDWLQFPGVVSFR